MISRFFVPRDSQISLDEHGFLHRPDGEYAEAYNPNLQQWTQLSRLPVIVILGEPSIGKSTVLTDAYHIDASVDPADVHSYDLGIFSDQATLAQELFGPNGPFQESADDRVTTIYLDSLDESKISIPTIERYLLDKLQHISSDRLRLRIACRTAVWSTVLEEFLKQKWGDQGVAILELAPLRIQDARAIAERRGQDATNFMEQVIIQNVGSLAARPGTLNLLLDVYAETGTLPTSRFELYTTGCRALLAESNRERRESGRMGRLSTEQRISLASRIAAVTMFANRGMISLKDSFSSNSKLIALADLEVPGTRPRQVSQAPNMLVDFREVLDTGVFSSRGPDIIGWAHQTFAEFLAANYLFAHELSTEQARSLFINVNDPLRRVAPQLWETAAWYSVRKPEFLRWLLDKEPELVLRSDVQLADPEMCEQVVLSILTLADDNRYFDTDIWTRRRYLRLWHPQLASQLRPYIVNQSHSLIARRIAMDIAEACKLEELSNELMDIALDMSEQYRLRINAAYAVQYIGEKSARQRMCQLLHDPHDENDELKGVAIGCLWPEFMSSDDLFRFLTQPRNEDLIGSYSILFEGSLLEHLRSPDCLPAINWVRNLSRSQLQNYSMGRFADAIMTHVLKYLDDPTVCEAFAETAWHLLKQHDSIFSRRWGSSKSTDVLEDTTQRRKVALALIRQCKNPADDGFYLFHYEERLVRDEDFGWLLDMTGSDIEPAADICAGLLGYRLHYDCSLEVFNQVLDEAAALASQGKPTLKAALSWLLNPIALDSPEADHARELARQIKELQEMSAARRYLPVSEHLEKALCRCEAGDTTHWVNVLTALSRENDESPTIWTNQNIFETPGWALASPDLRSRIRTAAISFLFQSAAPADDLTGRNHYRISELVFIPALLLSLFDPAHKAIDLPNEVWEKLTRPIVVTLMRDKEAAHWEQIIRLAQSNAAVSLFTAFQERLTFEIENESGFHLEEKVKHAWDAHYEELLRFIVQNPGRNSNHLRDVLEFLFKQNAKDMDRLCCDAIHAQLRQGNTELAAIYAATYLRHGLSMAWANIWPLMQSTLEFGRAVVMKMATFRDASRVLDLDEVDLSDLYIWLETAFPQMEDPEMNGWVSPRHEVANFRQELLGRLKNRGTRGALEALDRIIAVFPESLWLRSLRIDAENITRRAMWKPLNPVEIIDFVENANMIIVRDAQELADAIQQSLTRLQGRLYGHGGRPPLATALWDEASRRPKAEIRISELISLHLHDDLGNTGVIANREVEIRNHAGKGIGESVDLLVSCYCPDGDSHTHIASVVVEVKGCWNPSLYDDLTTQLSDRYLDNVDLRYGLYVVGYFPAGLWDDLDSRKAMSMRNTNGDIENLKHHLSEIVKQMPAGAPKVIQSVLDFGY